MQLRLALPSDLPTLAHMNWQLIRDEGHSNPMSVAELEVRMRAWLDADYLATLFMLGESPIGYALFRPDENGIYLRQFFVDVQNRRQGRGREAMRQLRSEFWPDQSNITVEVLCQNDRALNFWRAVGFVDYAVTLRLKSKEQPAS